MINMKNKWLQLNQEDISKIQRVLIEQSYSGVSDLFDFMKMHNIIGGCVIEITKLQTQINSLTYELQVIKEKKGS